MDDKIRHIDFDNNISRDYLYKLTDYTYNYFKQLPVLRRYNNPMLKLSNSEMLSPNTTASIEEILSIIFNELNKSGIQAASGNHL